MNVTSETNQTITADDVVMALYAQYNVDGAEECWNGIPSVLMVACEAVDLTDVGEREHVGPAAVRSQTCLHCHPNWTRAGAAHVLAVMLEAEGYKFGDYSAPIETTDAA